MYKAQKHNSKGSRKRKYNPHEPSTLYTLIHLEWYSECPDLDPTLCCGDIARKEEYSTVQRKRRKFDDSEDDISEEVDSEPDPELDRQLASVGLLSEASVLGMQKVRRMEIHRKAVKRKRNEEMRQKQVEKNYREANRSQRVQARAERRQCDNAAKQARKEAIQRVMKKDKDQARYDMNSNKFSIRYRGGKMSEDHYAYDDDYEEDWADDYDDDYNYYEEESYKPYEQPVCLFDDENLPKKQASYDSEEDFLMQAVANSLQEFEPNEKEDLRKAMEASLIVSKEDEAVQKALEASLVVPDEDSLDEDLQKIIGASAVDANSLEESSIDNFESDEALARALHEQWNIQESEKKGAWGTKPPKSVPRVVPDQKEQQKDVWGRPKSLSKSMAPAGGSIPMNWAKKVDKKGKKRSKKEAKRMKQTQEEDLSYELALIASMEENSSKKQQNFDEDEPLDVIDFDVNLSGWPCSVCTFLNGRADSHCLMCGTKKQMVWTEV